MRVIDVGTGAGFPGIPVKIACPEIELTLLDSLQKRIGFLQEVGSQLGLEGVHYVHSRAEDGGQNPQYREGFDLCGTEGPRCRGRGRAGKGRTEKAGRQIGRS